jgi:hypothetical protein
MSCYVLYDWTFLRESVLDSGFKQQGLLWNDTYQNETEFQTTGVIVDRHIPK